MSDFRRLSTAIATAFLIWPALSQTAQADGALDAYLPKSGTISGHVVTFAIAPEDQAISLRFRQAVQGNMDFFKHAVTSNTPGAPLPYDKHMGITEAQYEHLLHLKPEPKQGAAVTVAVKRNADGTIAFQPQDPASQPLKDVTFPPGEKAAVTPYGTLAIFNEIHQKDANAPLGVWDGAEWAQVQPAGADQPSAKIGFGKEQADGQGILYYQVAPFKDHGEQSLVVFYKLD